MKRILALLLLLSGVGFAQGVRIGDGTPVQSTLNLSGVGVILTPGTGPATIAICTYPANAVPCTNKATTYTTQALSVACATSVQVTLPGSSTCVANADSLGNWGAWVAPGSYDYTITVGSHSYGPYTVTNGNVSLTAAYATRDNSQDLNHVNVFLACSGVSGNGSSDDGPALQTCANNNPGASLMFPALRFTTTGATPTSFRSSVRLSMFGQGQEFTGSTYVKRLGGTKIKFDSGVGGILMPSTYNNQAVRFLFLEGGDLAVNSSTSTREDYNSISAITNLATSGIEAAGSSPTIEGVRVSSFKGHGIEIYGSSGGQPDFWDVRDSYIDFNRGFGLFVTGTDANVGKATHLSLEGNLLGGSYDFAFYGNTYDMIHTSQNASTLPAAGANKAVTAGTGLSVTSNVLTINTDVPNTWSAGQWITNTGATDGTFNQTCKLTTVGTSTATCPFTHADGTTGGGTAATSSGTQILAYYNAKGIATGPFSWHSTAGGTLGHTIYCEANQSDSVFNPNSITLNQQGACLTNVTTGHHIYGTSGPTITFKGGLWIFQPLIAGDILAVRNLAGDTNEFTVDISGNITSLGTKLNLGASPSANSNAINTSNTWGLYSKTTGGANSRGVYFHSDDTWYLGDSTRALHLQATATDASGTFAVTGTSAFTGLTTHTGGIKAGASGSTISDSRELVQSVHDCGTTTTCANTANLSEKIVRGTVALSSGTPSTAVVTGMTAFGGNTAAFYSCWLTNETTAANGVKYARTSSSSITITGPNTVTDVISYLCIGH